MARNDSQHMLNPGTVLSPSIPSEKDMGPRSTKGSIHSAGSFIAVDIDHLLDSRGYVCSSRIPSPGVPMSVSMDSMVVPGQEHGILALMECDFNSYSFSLCVCDPED